MIKQPNDRASRHMRSLIVAKILFHIFLSFALVHQNSFVPFLIISSQNLVMYAKAPPRFNVSLNARFSSLYSFPSFRNRIK